MAVSDFTVRVSGTVAYDDNSHGSFEATAIWKTNLGGVVAQHSSEDSQHHFSQLYADKAMGVDATLALLPGLSPPHGEVSVTPPAPDPNKLVTSFVMEVSGLTSDDDGSKSSFVAQWVNGTVNLYPDETVPSWLALTNPTNTEARALLLQVFDALAGMGASALS